MFLLIALFIGTLGASIILISDNDRRNKIVASIIYAVLYSLLSWWIIFGELPSATWSLFKWYPGLVLIWCAISAIVAVVLAWIIKKWLLGLLLRKQLLNHKTIL